VLDATPEADPVAAPPAEFANRPAAHSFATLLMGAFENAARYQWRQASRVLDHVDTGMRLVQRALDPSKGFGAAAELAPVTRFNRAVSRERSFATGELPLAEVKAIGKVTGTTLNDVFLAICSGGLRRYLGRLGELPSRSLVAGCPVSLRRPDDKSLNNQVTMMQVSFATDEEDPAKRLLKIAASSARAKGLVADIAASYDADVALPGLPAMLSATARLAERSGIANNASAAPFNMVVSNVPGPRDALYSLGGRVLTHYPVSIPAHGQAVNVTVQSYAGNLFFGVTGCARALPDAERFRDDLLAAYAELVAAVLGVQVAAPPAGSLIPLPARDRIVSVGSRRAVAGERPAEAA
jgi:WS/DGAT/MGAT family acyltransferase